MPRNMATLVKVLFEAAVEYTIENNAQQFALERTHSNNRRLLYMVAALWNGDDFNISRSESSRPFITKTVDNLSSHFKQLGALSDMNESGPSSDLIAS